MSNDLISTLLELLRARKAKHSGAPLSDYERKQAVHAPDRFYGSGGTIHPTEHLDVEVCDGLVVGVWFRCQQLPYQVTRVQRDEVPVHFRAEQLPKLKGVVVRD